jgi:phosphoribosylformimino-5-aminoimidazole carboxamide ribotide isomerase
MLACCHVIMRVIPAIDLLGDRAVRLRRGEYGSVVFHGSPLELARRFAAAGAHMVHVVDLDGARSGRVRPTLVERLVAAASPAAVQASGGIRSVADASRLLEAGATRVVVGTAAFSAPGAFREYADALGERLVIALDVRDGEIAVDGWTRRTAVTPEEAVDRCLAAGVGRLLCTAVERDGTLEGPDVALLERVVKRSGLPVLAAGGIRSESDLDALEAIGVEAVVVGRALVTGLLALPGAGAQIAQ